MEILLSLALAVLPSILILVYFLRKDRARPEPAGTVAMVFFLGILSTLPAILLELGIQYLGSGLQNSRYLYPPFRAYIVTGMVEEGLKLFIVMRFAFRRRHFDEIMDGIMLTVAAGMGFACLENVLYVIGRGFGVGILRAFTSVPMHASVSAVMGYHIGIARFETGRSGRRKMIMRGFLTAVLLHGSYNLCIFAMTYWTPATALGLFPVLTSAILLARKSVRSALALDSASGRISGNT